MKLVHILKTMVLEVGRGLFTANPPRAIEQDLLLFLPFEHFFHLGKFFAEGVHVWTDGAFEMSDATFVMVSHIHDDSVILSKGLMKGFRIEMGSDIGYIIFIRLQTIGDDLMFDLDGELPKGLSWLFYGDLEGHVSEFRMRIQDLHKTVPLGLWDIDLSIDALLGDIGSSEHTEFIPFLEELVTHGWSISDLHVTVERNRPTLEIFLSDFLESLFFVQAIEKECHRQKYIGHSINQKNVLQKRGFLAFFMKKFLTLCSVFALMLTLQACGSDEEVLPNSTLHTNADCLCEMRFPNDWESGTQYEKADFEFTAPDKLRQVLVFHGDVPEGQKADFNAYVQQTLQGIEESTEIYNNLSERVLTIDGMQAKQYEIETVSESQPIMNLLTIIEGDNGKLYQILAWSVASNYKNVVNDLHSIVNTFESTN